MSQCVPRNNSMYSDGVVSVLIFPFGIGSPLDEVFVQLIYMTNERRRPGQHPLFFPTVRLSVIVLVHDFFESCWRSYGKQGTHSSAGNGSSNRYRLFLTCPHVLILKNTCGKSSKICVYLCDLCTADVEDRAVSRGFSCSNFGKLLDISIAGGE